MRLISNCKSLTLTLILWDFARPPEGTSTHCQTTYLAPLFLFELQLCHYCPSSINYARKSFQALKLIYPVKQLKSVGPSRHLDNFCTLYGIKHRIKSPLWNSLNISPCSGRWRVQLSASWLFCGNWTLMSKVTEQMLNINSDDKRTDS